MRAIRALTPIFDGLWRSNPARNTGRPWIASSLRSSQRRASPFSRCGPHPSCCSRTNFFAPRTDLRQRMPAVDAVSSRSVLRATNVRKESKEAERRETRSQPPHPAGCGARRALRARLSASHHGTCCSERTPQLNPSYALPGTGLGRSGRYPLPAVLQCSGPKTADRSSCRPGVSAKVARVRR